VVGCICTQGEKGEGEGMIRYAEGRGVKEKKRRKRMQVNGLETGLWIGEGNFW
jgi:hypothetical protein